MTHAGPSAEVEDFKSGHCQRIRLAPDSATITDEMYGVHEIIEAPLLALLSSAPVRRLGRVHQHGMSGLLGLTPPVTRLEHSVGAMLLVRRVGGSVEEQAAALLHDISHTALSHVADDIFPCDGSYHEIHKHRYVATTCLPTLLPKIGLPDKVLDEELYGLVEQDSPHLCADRLDYGLRDAVAFKFLPLETAQAVFADLTAFPSPSAPKRCLALHDPKLALALARGYIATDCAVWGNPAHADMYIRAAALIRSLVENGRMAEDDLWLDDEVFWATMRDACDEDGRREMDALYAIPDEQGLRLRLEAKVRTLDPELVVDGSLAPLSQVTPEWKAERQAYIASRHILYQPPSPVPGASTRANGVAGANSDVCPGE
ncbi:phosphoribosyl-aminoimidazole-succinocarboxamide synthase [Cutaneotrichosporon oleaginosum]|uniref:Phosphoribosyl-aminoimidazole-succinocarboxamide synthase n=1 Tax=Cutaneotrichosporon oleaginosum TaxID=879819 RepID=A0A0J0XLZ6_9TREE|nr:phosphoribosyl-aminoimidazole-succinocarboxamide synthase [Cutaneotrichosporon oleaginosum]KLT42136.1 phosphoribosyl-aminoimidazole-succinocarboxamide synthase [Cutaneotrichosporon oleaginosum]TXT11739.1 hypothetical protein COLE_02149 [Cutaneotrichosporon oleaginosum]